MIDEAAKALEGWLFYLWPGKLQQSKFGLIEYALDTADRLHVIALYIKPEHRRKGFAEGYLRMIESEANTIIIWCSDKNKPMKSLLNKLGYQRMGKIREFYPNSDDGIMWRKNVNGNKV